MREAFAHEAVLAMAADGDTGAPGAAITVELCGHWDHEPPCPLAPHHTGARRVGEDLHLTILFVAAPDQEGEVRRRIDRALAAGRLRGPDGVTTRWQLLTSRRVVVPDDQRRLAQRLLGG
ncbi:hypothetical protein [Georgenia sp. SYP-B2076]|uniref:hypothetical protein n=1 Tax=Georgenia sp. SYP-B2076 TaxID=2495881 RepID=UPI000F8D5D80|nr:hypothetical protein [Georgenia sp. SYP-B2076]